MECKIKKNILLPVVFLLFVILPPLFSVLFALLHIPLPSYLFSFFLTGIIILISFERRFILSFSKKKTVFFLFFLWLIIGTQYGDSKIASEEKLIALIYTILIPVLMLDFLIMFTHSSRKEININYIEEIAYKSSKISIWIILVIVILFRQYDQNRIVLPGVNNPIWLTRLIGMLILILIYCKPVFANKPKHYITIIVAFILMTIFGSRMPMVSLIIVIILLRNNISSFSSNLFLLGFFVLLIGFGFIYIQESYLFETGFYSIYQRIDIFKQLQNLDFNYLKGIGTGSFGLFFSGVDMESYPHNPLIEIFIENGLIGLTLYCFLLIVLYKTFSFNIVMLLCLYSLLNSLTSGNTVGNNLFYILLFLSFYTPKNTLSDHFNIQKYGNNK